MNISKFQKFNAETIHRSAIKNAAYNPRIITDQARKKLKSKLKKDGLVMTLVWNRTKGNLVGGHQRISILDELEKSQDYSLTVAAIDVPEKQEKELNLFLNNQSAMGDWDVEALEKIIRDIGDIAETGFDLPDIQALCPSVDLAGVFADEKDKAATTIDELKLIKERRKAAKDKNKDRDDVEFYCVAVFQNRKQLDDFLTRAGFGIESRYIDGKFLAEKCGVKL